MREPAAPAIAATVMASSGLSVFSPVKNPMTAPMSIIPSTPRLRLPDFSVISSPTVANTRGVPATTQDARNSTMIMPPP